MTKRSFSGKVKICNGSITVQTEIERGKQDMAKTVPVWEKSNLTIEEASAYSGVGINKLRELSNDEDCPFVLWNGSKRLIKRKRLDDFLAKAYSI